MTNVNSFHQRWAG